MSSKTLASTIGVIICLYLQAPQPLHATDTRLNQSDADLSKALIGTWRDQTRAHEFLIKEVFTTYRTAGTFDQIAILEVSGLRARLESQGKWSVKDHVLTVEVTARGLGRRILKNKIISIDQARLVLRDSGGRGEALRSRIPENLPPASAWAEDCSQSTEMGRHCVITRQYPSYPGGAWINNVSGEGLFRIIVSGGEHPSAVEVIRGTGDYFLDQAATRALMQWRFKLGTVAKLTIPIRFERRNRT